jgi:hypothetical protein
MRRSDVIVAVLVCALLTCMVVAAAAYPPEARLVPLVIGIPSALLAAWQLYRDAAGRGGADEGTDGANQTGSRSAAARSIAWVLLFTLAVLAGGFEVGATLAVMVTYRVWLRESWRITATGGAVAFFLSYVCFERLLGLPLFPGWIALWIS